MYWARDDACGRKWFRAFQRARMSPQETTVGVFFLPKVKLSTVLPVLNGHSKRRPIFFKTDYRLMQVKRIAE